jgi:hypothetical protein
MVALGRLERPARRVRRHTLFYMFSETATLHVPGASTLEEQSMWALSGIPGFLSTPLGVLATLAAHGSYFVEVFNLVGADGSF